MQNVHLEATLYLLISLHAWYHKTASEKIKVAASTKVRHKTVKHVVYYSEGIQMLHPFNSIIMFYFQRQWIYLHIKCKCIVFWIYDAFMPTNNIVRMFFFRTSIVMFLYVLCRMLINLFYFWNEKRASSYSGRIKYHCRII